MNDVVVETTPDASNAPPPAAPDAGTQTPSNGTLTAEPTPDDSTAPREPDVSDVRRLLAGEDAKFAKQLERFRTTDDMRKSWLESQAAASKKAEPLKLGEDATDEQVGEFRKALGLTDKPEEYPINFREGFEITDADTEVLSGFKEALHAKAGDPRTAALAMEWYQDTIQQQMQDRDETAALKAEETQEALRAEYGTEYKGNLEAASSFLRSQLGEEAFNDFTDKRFADGTKWQDDADFVKMFVNLGRDHYGGTGIISGDVETTVKTLNDKIADFRKMQTEDPDTYRTEEVQAQVAALYDQKRKLDARKR